MPRRKTLYVRATAVVVNEYREVLLVKHNRQNDWALPGGRVLAGEDPALRARLEVAEETGVQVGNLRHIGRYAGSVAAHEIYLAQGAGELRPNHREIQDAVWWDMARPLKVQQHVSAILATAANQLESPAPQRIDADAPSPPARLDEGT